MRLCVAFIVRLPYLVYAFAVLVFKRLLCTRGALWFVCCIYSARLLRLLIACCVHCAFMCDFIVARSW